MKPNTLTEKYTQNKVCEWAKKRRIEANRQHKGAGAGTGWPDVQFILPAGRSVWIEFKSPGKKATARQLHIIGKLEKAGHEVHVCDDPERAIDILAAALDSARSELAGETRLNTPRRS
jgi:hypothetical protein